MKFKKTATLLIVSSFSIFASAQYEFSPVATKILKQLKIPESKINFELYSEKIMPGSPERSIYVLPQFSEDGKEDFNEDYFEMDANIIIANNKTGNIIAKYQYPNAYTSDAVKLTSLEIDTGLYLLNSTTRSFGIRENYTGSSRPNPYSQTLLSLFIINKHEMKTVLNDLEINSSIGEWDTNCAGTFEAVEGIIVFQDTKNNGFRNIVVKYNTTKTTNSFVNDDCVSVENKGENGRMLQYNGKEYN